MNFKARSSAARTRWGLRARIETIVSSVALAVTLGALGCQQGTPQEGAATEKTPPDSPTPNVRVAPALLDSGRVELTEVRPFAYGGSSVVPGEVAPAPDGEAEIGSLVAGRIASLEAVEGNLVNKGQVLAWLDSPEVGSVRADLARANAQAAAANKRLDRQLALQSQGATSQGALDEARSAVQTAQVDQQAARTRLGSVGVTGATATGRVALRSPIAGMIVERNATLGGSVTPDTLLFRVIDTQRLRVKARWSVTLGPVPAIGTTVHLDTRRARTTVAGCEGKVDSHLGVVDPATRAITLQIQPDKSCTALTAGAYVEVLVETAQPAREPNQHWTQVPIEALVDLRGIPTVFVATAERGVFEQRRVVPGATVGGVAPIAAGLDPGERVASKGVILLKGEALREILGSD